MAGWRDRASEDAQQDLDGLLDLVLQFARRSLDARGELSPYGATVDLNGEEGLVYVEWTASGAEMVSNLFEGIRSQRDELRAVAVVADVTTPDGDAARVALEHREGLAMVVLLPYRKRRLRGGLEYGDLISSAGSPQVWTMSA